MSFLSALDSGGLHKFLFPFHTFPINFSPLKLLPESFLCPKSSVAFRTLRLLKWRASWWLYFLWLIPCNIKPFLNLVMQLYSKCHILQVLLCFCTETSFCISYFLFMSHLMADYYISCRSLVTSVYICVLIWGKK